ncbi:Lipoprotein-releasing system ATP-binding protein LolD [Pirellula sp. SH-Sr6A]|uniref:ABC transporter ATP-binding protein n=1 Tax=Pirellula sp. SH-Sr6A TaxID=1632865 RepID=UPI00078C75EC|nr:ABC transporter ATP-binding protein [Pirellula sp. SH-Sr6A]AMV33875.1 Lipoprotein-releasing system ATP-binding protein LolD [Pirellula sp. SH-Sr6A]
MSALIARNISKFYPTPAEDLVILEHVDLTLEAGQNAAIIGPSGSGKSTLLQILGVLDRPTSGTLSIRDQDPFALSETAQARFRNDHIGFVFQDHHLLPQWNVLENTLLPGLAQGRPDAAMRQRAHYLLERVGLQDRLHHLPSQLSGGERERVAVARALLRKPLLVLADEPTGNLDEENAAKISDLLLAMPREENAILIVVTHSMELARKMERCFELKQKKLQPKSF